METDKIKRFVKRRINSNRKKRPVRRYTDEQMFEALRRVGKGERISENGYTRQREKTDPTAACFYARFGSFKAISEMVFGKPPVTSFFKEKVDEEYMVKLISDFGISTKEQYVSKNKENPEIFPSEYQVLKMFKNYGNLFAASKKWSIDRQLMLCLGVRLKLKKSPNIEEYRKEGINTEMLMRKYVTLKNLNRFVRLLEEAHEVSERNKDKTGTDDEKAIEREEKKVFRPFSEQLRS